MFLVTVPIFGKGIFLRFIGHGSRKWSEATPLPYEHSTRPKLFHLNASSGVLVHTLFYTNQEN